MVIYRQLLTMTVYTYQGDDGRPHRLPCFSQVRNRGTLKVPALAAPQPGSRASSGSLGTAPARLLRLLRACQVAPGSSALSGWGPTSGIPATASPQLLELAASNVAHFSPRLATQECGYVT